MSYLCRDSRVSSPGGGSLMSGRIMKETERVEAPRSPGHGMMAGQVGQKALNFGPSFKRLIGHLRPEQAKLLFVLSSALISVGLVSFGPRVLGWETDIVFAGAIGA